MVYQMVSFSSSTGLNDQYPHFKGAPLIEIEYLRNSIRQRHSYNNSYINFSFSFYMFVCMRVLDLIVNHFNFTSIFMGHV